MCFGVLPDSNKFIKAIGRESGTWDLLPYYNNLHTEHLTSYTNTLQLTDYQPFA